MILLFVLSGDLFTRYRIRIELPERVSVLVRQEREEVR